MNPGCRVTGLFLVGLGLFQSLAVAVDAWQAQQWPMFASEWVRLALLPAALLCALFQPVGALSVRQWR
jgi:hypothetical protein